VVNYTVVSDLFVFGLRASYLVAMIKKRFEHRSELLKTFYRELNRRRYVHPDPVEFLYDYNDRRDREIVALVASSLAYGRVKQILRSVQNVLDKLGPNPSGWLMGASRLEIRRTMRRLPRHRFATGEQIGAMLLGAKSVIASYGSLEACFANGLRSKDETILPALGEFVGRIIEASKGGCGHLLPDPTRGSACKRPNLMLRWLVRCDKVDPGGWSCVGTDKLIIPLDTHMHNIALTLGMTKRKAADMRTALEVTAAFAKILPSDPVRYDFALTRLGIRNEMTVADLFDIW